MDEQLINEYINNLANQVNTLNQENILLKTRLSLLEKREAERMEQVAAAEQKVVDTFSTPPAPAPTPAPVVETQPEPVPEPVQQQQEPEAPREKMVRAPRPKGYNPKVDGPRPLVPESSLRDES